MIRLEKFGELLIYYMSQIPQGITFALAFYMLAISTAQIVTVFGKAALFIGRLVVAGSIINYRGISI